MRCLIVDDSQDFLRAASNLLDGDGINVVGVASTGAQAYDACRELRPDVILLDMELGEETGFDVARRLAADPGLDKPRVILISAYSACDLGDLITAAPVASFLPKAALSATAVLDILARHGVRVSGR